MTAFLVSLLMAVTDPSILTVHAYAQEIIEDPKELWIDSLVNCESGGNVKAKVLDTNGYFSRGILQFQLSTWLAYGKAFGATRENIYDADLQRTVARDMLDNGGWRHWYNCSKKIMKVLGKYPI